MSSDFTRAGEMMVEIEAMRVEMRGLTDSLHESSQALAKLMMERDAWRKLARARGRILVAYRVGGRTPGKAIDDAIAAEAKLAELGVTLDG